MHVNDEKIELLVLEPERFSLEERDQILAHINSCSLCKEVYDTYKNMYNEIYNGMETPPAVNDIEFATKIKQRISTKEDNYLLTENAHTVQIYNGNTEIISKRKSLTLQNIYYFVKSYPVPSFGFAVITVLAVAFIIGQVKNSIKDTNPTFADVKNGSLNIYNSTGDLLWKKPASGISIANSDTFFRWVYGNHRSINITDLDTDGKNEILVTGDQMTIGQFKCDSLYCFNSNGTRRWVASPESEKYNYAPNWKRTGWEIRDFFTVRWGKKIKLYAIANDKIYGGAIISEIDSKSGKILGSLYHAGYFSQALSYDINGDGNDEIFLGGSSTGYYHAFFMAVEPDKLMGAIHNENHLKQFNLIKGNPEYYILMPISNFGRLLMPSESYDVAEIRGGNKTVTVFSIEAIIHNKQYPILYTFNKDMRVINVFPSTSFLKEYDTMLHSGKLTVPLDSNYWNSLKDSVLYWDGDKYVNYPAKNRYSN